MSDELKINGPSLDFAKGILSLSVAPAALAIDVAGVHRIDDIGTATASDDTLSKGSIGTIGWFFIQNLGDTNNLLVGTDGTNYQVMLKPSESAAWRVNGSNVHVKSSAGTTDYYYAMIEN
jgi:hypothetical protein